MAEARLEGSPTGIPDIKRFYLPGVVLKTTCPRCGTPKERDFGSNPLNYPELGPIYLGLYCSHCEYEWNLKAELKVELTLVGGGEPE